MAALPITCQCCPAAQAPPSEFCPSFDHPPALGKMSTNSITLCLYACLKPLLTFVFLLTPGSPLPLTYGPTSPIMSSREGFSFTDLLLSAIAIEEALDGDDTEGYPFEPAGNASPLNLVSQALTSDQDEVTGYTTPPEMGVRTMSPSSPVSSSRSTTGGSLPTSPVPTPTMSPSGKPLRATTSSTGSTPGATKTIRLSESADSARLYGKKQGSKARRYLKRQQDRKKTTARHVLPSIPVHTSLKTQKLKHTKAGFTGPIDRRCTELYSLTKMTGDGLGFRFELKTWDGR